MVAGVSGGYPVVVPADRGTVRQERKNAPAEAALFEPGAKPNSDRSLRPGSAGEARAQDEGALFQRRIEARLQAQAARLEKDDTATLPRQNQQALQTYSDVASTRDDYGVEVLGLDLRA